MYLKTNFKFVASKKTSFTLTGDYNSKRIAVVGVVLPRYGADISLKHKFLNNNEVSFYFDLNDKILFDTDCIMTDVFNSMNDKEDKELLLKKFQIHIQHTKDYGLVFQYFILD